MAGMLGRPIMSLDEASGMVLMDVSRLRELLAAAGGERERGAARMPGPGHATPRHATPRDRPAAAAGASLLLSHARHAMLLANPSAWLSAHMHHHHDA